MMMPRLSLLLLLAALFAAGPSRAQVVDSSAGRVVGLRADSMTVRRVGDREIVELLGVRLEEDGTVLWANRMVDEGNGQMMFYDNVRVVDESDTLTTRRLRYDRNTKIGRATGGVRLSDGEVVVTADEGDYDTEAKRADFRNDVRMVDSVSVLTSLMGVYFSRDKRAEFQGEVLLRGREADVSADSIVYYRDTEISEASGRVVIARKDSASSQRTYVRAGRVLDEPRTGRAQALGQVFLAQIRTDSTGAPVDTLFIEASRLLTVRSDTLDRFSAMDSVRVWGAEFVALADSVVHDARETAASKRSESRLFGDPVAWFRTTQITGDTLMVQGGGSGIDTLRVFGSAFVARMDTVLGRLQQLKGGRLVGLFEGDSLKSLAMSPRAEAIYHLIKDTDQAGGAVRTSADRIVFRFSGDEVTDLRIYDGVEGTYFTEELITSPLKLEGLRWDPARRPDRAPLRGVLDAMRCRLEACEEN
jgi:lipopolysaccharide export system protein LptA